jgi:hypothetical protein
MSNQLIDSMAWCLRAHRNALKQGRPVSVDVERTTEGVLRQYDAVRTQNVEGAHDNVARTTDGA